MLAALLLASLAPALLGDLVFEPGRTHGCHGDRSDATRILRFAEPYFDLRFDWTAGQAGVTAQWWAAWSEPGRGWLATAPHAYPTSVAPVFVETPAGTDALLVVGYERVEGVRDPLQFNGDTARFPKASRDDIGLRDTDASRRANAPHIPANTALVVERWTFERPGIPLAVSRDGQALGEHVFGVPPVCTVERLVTWPGAEVRDVAWLHDLAAIDQAITEPDDARFATGAPRTLLLTLKASGGAGDRGGDVVFALDLLPQGHRDASDLVRLASPNTGEGALPNATPRADLRASGPSRASAMRPTPFKLPADLRAPRFSTRGRHARLGQFVVVRGDDAKGTVALLTDRNLDGIPDGCEAVPSARLAELGLEPFGADWGLERGYDATY